MDRLYKRYADPFSFINGMILSGRFCEFVQSFWLTTQREESEEKNWQFYLHKVFEGSFDDFVGEMKTTAKNQNMPKRTFETTIKNSMNILDKLSHQEGGET